MSDISGGAPLPKAVQPVSHGTDKAASVSRDKQQANTQTQGEDGRDQKKPQQQEATTQARDPAVSISASAAHLQVGEELKQKVTVVDPEGRPIIETETATFALRPDAGLKAGDDVTLLVKDTSKQLAADLLQHNGANIDPPIRLNLIVIAIHSVEPANPAKPETPPPAAANYKPTQAVAHTKVSTVDTEAEALAKVLARSPAAPASAATTVSPQAAKPETTVQAPNNLSALISAQQSASGGQSAPQQPNIQQQPQNPFAANQPADHILKPTPLTEPSIAQSVSAAGLGNIIPAITTSGTQVNIQLLDPSVSKVSPAEVAKVIMVRALTPQDAKALPISAAPLGNTSALAHVETDKGVYVLNQSAANSLTGELIRVSSAGVQEGPQAKAAPYSHPAKLLGPSTSTPRSITVQFPEQPSPPTNAAQNVTTITAVHTVRAFLTAEGPRSDLRLETPLGDITLTLANNTRPAPGDIVTVMAQQQSQTGAAPQAAMAAATVAGSATGLSPTQWPTLEQAFSVLQAAGPLGTEALQSLTARSAQGGDKLGNSAMFLLSALKGGNASNWLGKTAEQALAKRNPQLLDLLKDDISRLFNIATETSGEWRALLLPFDTRNPDMPMLAFLFNQGSSVDPDQHGQGKNKPDDEEDADTKRFVLEVQFSVLGPVQLDGTIKGNHFDLMVRSERQFPPKLTQDTSQLFSDALAASAFTGSLAFSVEETFPIDVAQIINQKNVA